MSAPIHARAKHLGPDVRRPLVLDAALKVWIEHGYSGTTMTRIAEAAQVSKPVIYSCYANKDKALFALLRREEARLLGAALDALPGSFDFEDPAAVMRSSFEAFFRATLEHPDSWRVVVDAPFVNDPAVTAAVTSGRSAIVDQLTDLLSHHLVSSDRTMPHDRIHLFARNLVALAEVNATFLNEPDSTFDWDPAELAAVVVDFAFTNWV